MQESELNVKLEDIVAPVTLSVTKPEDLTQVYFSGTCDDTTYTLEGDLETGYELVPHHDTKGSISGSISIPLTGTTTINATATGIIPLPISTTNAKTVQVLTTGIESIDLSKIPEGDGGGGGSSGSGGPGHRPSFSVSTLK
jgi:hypothetical protein